MRALLLLLLAAPAAALGNRVGESTAQFLRFGAGARALALGEAYTGLAEGPEAIFWNPAGLADQRRPALHYSRTELLTFFHHDFAAYAQPLGRGALGASFTRFSQNSMPLVNNSNVVVGRFSPHSEAVAVAYARHFAADDPEEADRGYFRDAWVLPGAMKPLRHELDPWQGAFSAGLSLKVIREAIHAYEATAFAVDAGVLYHPIDHERAKLAAAVRNLGSQERFIEQAEPLPAELALAASYDLQYEDRSRLVPTLEVAVPLHARVHGKAGLEWAFPAGDLTTVALRAGYKSLAVPDLGALAGLTGGVGVGLRRFSADFAFQPMAELGEVYRLSLGWKF